MIFVYISIWVSILRIAAEGSPFDIFEKLDGLKIAENIPKGTIVFKPDRSKAGEDGVVYYYSFKKNEYVAFNSSSYELSVIGDIDYEVVQTFMLEITAQPFDIDTGVNDNATVAKQFMIFLEDLNDVVPVFVAAPPYSVTVPRIEVPGTVILEAVEVSDQDGVGGPIRVSCFQFPDEPNEACEVFDVAYQVKSGKMSTANISLRQSLMSLTTPKYHFALNASDGANSLLAEVFVTVEGLEPTTAEFLLTSKSTFPENEPRFSSDHVIIEMTDSITPGSIIPIHPRISIDFGEYPPFNQLQMVVRQINPTPVEESSDAAVIKVVPEMLYSSSDLDLIFMNQKMIDSLVPNADGFKVLQLEVLAIGTSTSNDEVHQIVLPITMAFQTVKSSPTVFSEDAYYFQSQLSPERLNLGRIGLLPENYGLMSDPNLEMALLGPCAMCYAIMVTPPNAISLIQNSCPNLPEMCDMLDSGEVMLLLELKSRLITDVVKVPIFVEILLVDQLMLVFEEEAYFGEVNDSEFHISPTILAKISPLNNKQNKLPNPIYMLDDYTGHFAIDNSSGTVFVHNPAFGALVGQNVTLTIRAVVQGTEQPLSTSVPLYVRIKDLMPPNNPPKFVQPSYQFTVNRTLHSERSIIGKVSAVDADADNLNYTLISSNSNAISISAQTGEIIYKGGESILSTIETEILVRDNGQPSMADTVRASITVLDPQQKDSLLLSSAKMEKYYSLARGDAADVFIDHLFVRKSDVSSYVYVYAVAIFYRTVWMDNFEEATDVYKKNFHVEPVSTLCSQTGDPCPKAWEVEAPTPDVDYFSLLVQATFPNDLLALRVVLQAESRSISFNKNTKSNPLALTFVFSAAKFSTQRRISGSSFLPPGPYHSTVAENEPNGAFVYHVHAQFADNSPAAYRLGEPSSYFEIHRTRGIVTLKDSLDYEFIPSHILTIIASDQQTGSKLNTTLRISVLNQNDYFPEFKKKFYKMKAKEGAPAHTALTEVEAVDLDGDEVEYYLTGNYSQYFQITHTGKILLAKELDREELGTELTIYAVAEDIRSGNPYRLSAFVPVYFTLQDENDNTPVFRKPAYSAAIVENTPPGTQVIRISAWDPDEGPDGHVQYAIENEPEELKDSLVIDPIHGYIYTEGSLIGKSGRYHLEVKASDGGGLHAVVPLYLAVQQTSQCAPFFTKPTPNVTVVNVNEHSPIGHVIMRIHAETPGNCNVQYGFLDDSDTDGKFQIDPESGELVNSVELDREEKEVYHIWTIARSTESGGLLQAQKEIEIRVNDIDDHAPTFKNPNCRIFNCSETYGDGKLSRFLDYWILENTATNVPLVKVEANDPDLGKLGAIEYEILPKHDHAYFYIEPSSGWLYANVTLDYELRSVYLLDVRARNPYFNDSKSWTDAEVLIHVLDSDDNYPKFQQPEYIFPVPNTAAEGDYVGRVFAVDEDFVDKGSRLTYTITDEGSRPHPTFRIEAYSGKIYLKRNLSESELSAYHEMEVQARSMNPNSEGFGKTIVTVWIYRPDDVLQVLIEKDLDLFIKEREEIIRILQKSTGKDVLIQQMKHVVINNRVDPNKTELHVLLVDEGYRKVVPEDKAQILMRQSSIGFTQVNSQLQFASIKQAYPAETRDGKLTSPVIALIAIICVLLVGLLILGLIFCNQKMTQSKDARTKTLHDTSRPRSTRIDQSKANAATKMSKHENIYARPQSAMTTRSMSSLNSSPNYATVQPAVPTLPRKTYDYVPASANTKSNPLFIESDTTGDKGAADGGKQARPESARRVLPREQCIATAIVPDYSGQSMGEYEHPGNQPDLLLQTLAIERQPSSSISQLYATLNK